VSFKDDVKQEQVPEVSSRINAEILSTQQMNVMSSRYCRVKMPNILRLFLKLDNEDLIAKKLSELLLKGYKMLNATCEECTVG
jgi:hypothetical protein